MLLLSFYAFAAPQMAYCAVSARACMFPGYLEILRMICATESVQENGDPAIVRNETMGKLSRMASLVISGVGLSHNDGSGSLAETELSHIIAAGTPLWSSLRFFSAFPSACMQSMECVTDLYPTKPQYADNSLWLLLVISSVRGVAERRQLDRLGLVPS